MKKKIIRAISLIMVICSLLSSQAFAINDSNLQKADESEAFVRTSHTSDPSASTGKYLYGADVIAQNGATSTYVSIVIQQRNSEGEYVDVPGTFRSSTKNGIYASVGDIWYVYGGYWYRTQATYIVTMGGKQYKVVDNSRQYWIP